MIMIKDRRVRHGFRRDGMDFFHGKDPARVKEPPGPVACGGDWRQPGISNRVEYLRSRGERRDNLGFRIVRDVR